MTNQSGRARRISVFTYCEFANLWDTYQDLVNLQYSLFITRATLEDGILGITCNPNYDFDGRDLTRCQRTWMALTGAPLAGVETVREKFLGSYGGYRAPEVVIRGRCSDFLAEGDNVVGAGPLAGSDAGVGRGRFQESSPPLDPAPTLRQVSELDESLCPLLKRRCEPSPGNPPRPENRRRRRAAPNGGPPAESGRLNPPAHPRPGNTGSTVRRRVLKVFDYFRPFQNADGLLQDLKGRRLWNGRDRTNSCNL